MSYLYTCHSFTESGGVVVINGKVFSTIISNLRVSLIPSIFPSSARTETVKVSTCELSGVKLIIPLFEPITIFAGGFIRAYVTVGSPSSSV